MEFIRSGSAKKTICIGNPLIQDHQHVLDHLLHIGFINTLPAARSNNIVSGLEKRFNGRVLGHYTIKDNYLIIYILDNDSKKLCSYTYHFVYSDSFKKMIWVKCQYTTQAEPKLMLNDFIKWVSSDKENTGQTFLKIELL